MTDSRDCAVCGTTFRRAATHGPLAWRRRVTCSERCKGMFYRAPLGHFQSPAIRCVECGGDEWPRLMTRSGECRRCAGVGEESALDVRAYLATREGRQFVAACRAVPLLSVP